MEYKQFKTAAAATLRKHAKELFGEDIPQDGEDGMPLGPKDLRLIILNMYAERSLQMEGYTPPEYRSPGDGEDEVEDLPSTDPELEWMEECYGKETLDSGKPLMARVGKREKRIQVTIHQEENEPEDATFSINTRAIRLKRGEKVSIPWPYFHVLENSNESYVVQIEGVDEIRTRRRFNYTTHGMIWFKNGKPDSELIPLRENAA